jgi:hypothetical protein
MPGKRGFTRTEIRLEQAAKACARHLRASPSHVVRCRFGGVGTEIAALLALLASFRRLAWF